MSVKLRPLTEAAGVEVRGVDLRRVLRPDEIAEIRAAWERWGVLVFHDQQLALDDQLRFTQAFGDVQVTRAGPREGTTFVHIANATVDGVPGDLPNGEMMFHQDGCYAENPAKQTSLFAMEIPRRGGNTKFASTGRAYDLLAPELREQLLDYDIHYSYDYTSVIRDERTQSGPQCTHPLVIAYPADGRPLLFCNRLMAERIVGLPSAESDALIARLCSQIEQPGNIYEHVWRVGDFVAWDNLLTQHARTDFDPNERRVLRRTQTVGTKTVPYRDTVRAHT